MPIYDPDTIKNDELDSVGPWTLIKSFPGQHTYWAHNVEKRIAIADRSGSTPDTTDDGILWIDFEERPSLTLQGFYIPVRRVNGDKYHVPISNDEAMWIFKDSTYGFKCPVCGGK